MVPQHRAVLARRTRTLGDRHRDTLRSRAYLARTLSAQEDGSFSPPESRRKTDDGGGPVATPVAVKSGAALGDPSGSGLWAHFPNALAAIRQAQLSGCTWAACGPFWPCSMLNETR